MRRSKFRKIQGGSRRRAPTWLNSIRIPRSRSPSAEDFDPVPPSPDDPTKFSRSKGSKGSPKKSKSKSNESEDPPMQYAVGNPPRHQVTQQFIKQFYQNAPKYAIQNFEKASVKCAALHPNPNFKCQEPQSLDGKKKYTTGAMDRSNARQQVCQDCMYDSVTQFENPDFNRQIKNENRNFYREQFQFIENKSQRPWWRSAKLDTIYNLAQKNKRIQDNFDIQSPYGDIYNREDMK